MRYLTFEVGNCRLNICLCFKVYVKEVICYILLNQLHKLYDKNVMNYEVIITRNKGILLRFKIQYIYFRSYKATKKLIIKTIININSSYIQQKIEFYIDQKTLR